ncbi:tetratricopeptide repeat protein [Nitrospirillum sp. BR 11752]|nr:tetratricopeptide repeat protein [Nitrospirillum sp. BR 11752]
MATVEDTLTLALSHHDAGRLAEAEALYGRVVAMAPDHVQALFLWGAAAHLRGDPGAALPRLERARYLAPTATVITALLAAVHRTLGGRATAETLYREVLAAEPRHGEAAAALAEMLEEEAKALQARGDMAAALSHDEQAVTVLRTAGLSPKPTLWNSLGAGLLAAGRREEAISAFESAVAADPRYGEALSNLGGALKAAKRLDEAAARYRQALALFPKVPELHTNLGTVLAELNQPVEALAAYQEAVRLNPAFVGGWLNVGMGRHAVDDLHGAADAYHRALALDPSFIAPGPPWAPSSMSWDGSRKRRRRRKGRWRSIPAGSRQTGTWRWCRCCWDASPKAGRSTNGAATAAPTPCAPSTALPGTARPSLAARCWCMSNRAWVMC